MPEIGAGEVSAAGPATCAAYAPVTSAAAAKVSQHRLIARSGELGRELTSNRDPPRFPFICLIRRLESSLGGVPIGADRDPAMRANKQASCDLSRLWVGSLPAAETHLAAKILKPLRATALAIASRYRDRSTAAGRGLVRPVHQLPGGSAILRNLTAG